MAARTLGANSVFVGGDDLVLSPTPVAFERYGRFCVVTLSDVQRPSELLAFASARGTFSDAVVESFYRVEPPYLARRIWAPQYREAMAPDQYGFVHPRYSGRTVAAVIDGHAAALSTGTIQDMRRWANGADRPDWILEQR
jgi:hypothetical protein